MWQTVWANGGWVLMTILITSVVGLGVVIERLWLLLPLAARHHASWRHAESELRAGRAPWPTRPEQPDRPAAHDAVQRLVQRGLAERAGGAKRVREAALLAVQAEVPALERGLGVLATVAQIAPLLGLLGTVVGLVEAFHAASLGQDKPQDLAGGIFKALGTTVAGLVVAIPAWIAYNSLVALSGRRIAELEQTAQELPLVASAKAVGDAA